MWRNKGSRIVSIALKRENVCVCVCVCLCFVTQLCLTLCNPMDCSPPDSSVHGDSPGKNTGVGCPALLQSIFPTQRLNPSLPHCRWILYHLRHQGSPKWENKEWEIQFMWTQRLLLNTLRLGSLGAHICKISLISEMVLLISGQRQIFQLKKISI